MPKRFTVEMELPDEVVATLGDENVAAKVKESLIMELLREHRISQGKAAELLGVSRVDLFPLMKKYQVAAIDLSAEELDDELRKPFPSE